MFAGSNIVVSDQAKKRAEAAKLYIENQYKDRSRNQNDRRARYILTNQLQGHAALASIHKQIASRNPADESVQTLGDCNLIEGF